VPARQQGTASALLTTAQYLAGAVTLAVLTLVLERVPGYAGFGAAFAVTAVAAVAGGVVAVAAGTLSTAADGATVAGGGRSIQPDSLSQRARDTRDARDTTSGACRCNGAIG
jgi:hypothetical protein